MKDRFKQKILEVGCSDFHSQTAGSTLTDNKPQNNVVRVALQALASVLGGTQSLHTNSLDEALALPTEESARLALRTQQVIALESNVTQTVGPSGRKLVCRVLDSRIGGRELFNTLKKLIAKGTISCIESGFISK